MLTVALVEKALPSNLKCAVTQSLVDDINNASADPIVAEQIRENFISYTHVLRDGKFKTEDYINAVKYVSFKLMGHSNQDAYFKTFPTRYQTLVAKGTSAKDISSYVSAFAKGKLVNLIMEQSLIPSWVLNQEMYQKAINVQADLMANAQSEKVRCDAANSILTHLSKPKEGNFQIAIDAREDSGVRDLKETLTTLAQQQQQLIQAGWTTKQVAESNIIDVETE